MIGLSHSKVEKAEKNIEKAEKKKIKKNATCVAKRKLVS